MSAIARAYSVGGYVRVHGVSAIATLVLFSTDGCHLCHQAEALLREVAGAGLQIEWQVVDIALDDALFARYGWSIPVLRREDGTELGWPFDAAALTRFIVAPEGQVAQE